MIRTLFHGNPGGSQGFLRTACLVQLDAEIVVSAPRLGVERDDVVVEGNPVPVDFPLGARSPFQAAPAPPSQDPPPPTSVSPAAGRRPVHGGANEDCHDPDAGQVLKAVGHQGVTACSRN